MLAVSSVIPEAIFDFTLWVNVLIRTILIVTFTCIFMHVCIYFFGWVVLLTKFTEEMTLWHFRHVVFMKVLTIISFLAQVTDPVFTYNSSTLP